MKKQKPIWKIFEERIVTESEAKGYTCVKVPNDVRGLYSHKPIQVKTSFDFCCGVNGLALFFDAKSENGGALYIDAYITSEKKIHQFHALQACHLNNNKAGYLCLFYEQHDVISWIPIPVIIEARRLGVKCISPETPGVVSQDSGFNIDLKLLCFSK